MDLYQILIMLDILESIEIFCSAVFLFSFAAASGLGLALIPSIDWYKDQYRKLIKNSRR